MVVTTGVKTTSGLSFIPVDPNSILQEVFFEVELGASVAGVIPQPTNAVQAGGNVTVTQQRDVVDVYFDDADLFDSVAGNSLVDPQYYQVTITKSTIEYSDDVNLPLPSTIIAPWQRLQTLTLSTAPSITSHGTPIVQGAVRGTLAAWDATTRQAIVSLNNIAQSFAAGAISFGTSSSTVTTVGASPMGYQIPKEERYVRLVYPADLDVLAGGAANLRLRIGDNLYPNVVSLTGTIARKWVMW